VEVQASAEGREFSGEEFQDLLALGEGGIRQLTEIQQSVLHMNFRGRAA
jgi:ribonuclease PH